MRIHEYTDLVRNEEFHNDVIRVRLVDDDGQQVAGGLIVDVPTEIVPPWLRRFGQIFRLRRKSIWPEEGDSAESLRDQARNAFDCLGE